MAEEAILNEFMTMLIPGYAEKGLTHEHILTVLTTSSSTFFFSLEVEGILQKIIEELPTVTVTRPSKEINMYTVKNSTKKDIWTNRTSPLAEGKCGIVRIGERGFVYKQIFSTGYISPHHLLLDTLKEVFTLFVACRLTHGKAPDVKRVFKDERNTNTFFIQMTNMPGEVLSKYIIKTPSFSNGPQLENIITQALNIFKSLHPSGENVWIIHGDTHHGNWHYDSTTGQLYLFDFGLGWLNFYGKIITTNSSTTPPITRDGHVLDTSYAMFLVCFIDMHFTAMKMLVYQDTLPKHIINMILSCFGVNVDGIGSFNLYHYMKSPWCSVTFKNPFHLLYWSDKFMKKWTSPISGTGDFAPLNMKRNTPGISDAFINGIMRMSLFYPGQWKDTPFTAAIYPPVATVQLLKDNVLILNYIPRVVAWTLIGVAGAVGAVGAAFAGFCGKPQQATESGYTEYDDDQPKLVLRKSGRVAAANALVAVMENDAVELAAFDTRISEEIETSPDHLNAKTADIKKIRAGLEEKIKNEAVAIAGESIKPTMTPSRGKIVSDRSVRERVINKIKQSLVPSRKPVIMPKNLKAKHGGRRTYKKKLKSKSTRRKSRSHSHESYPNYYTSK